MGLFIIWLVHYFGLLINRALSSSSLVNHLGLGFITWACVLFGLVYHLSLFITWVCSSFGLVHDENLFMILTCSLYVLIHIFGLFINRASSFFVFFRVWVCSSSMLVQYMFFCHLGVFFSGVVYHLGLLIICFFYHLALFIISIVHRLGMFIIRVCSLYALVYRLFLLII